MIATPNWLMPGLPLYDLDFINQRYWGGYVDQKVASEDRTSLCSDGGGYSTGMINYTPDRDGLLIVGGSGSQNRITNIGLYTERGATNQTLWARDMTNAAWVISNTTDITAQLNQPSADNLATASTATLLTANANNATILQTLTLTSRIFVYSAYVKRVSGSGVINMTMDGGLTWTPITLTSSYALCQIPAQTLANPSFGFQITTSGDAIAVDFNQGESGSQVKLSSKATTPLPTTNATVTRQNQVGYFSTSTGITVGNAGQAIYTNVLSTGGPFSILMSWNGDVTTVVPNGPMMIATDGVSPQTWDGGIGVGFGNGTQRTTNQGTNGRGNWNITCGRTNGQGTKFCINGGALSANAGGTNNLPSNNSAAITAKTAHFNLGNNGAGTGDFPLNGSIGRATFWNHEITDGQMIEFTTLANGYGQY